MSWSRVYAMRFEPFEVSHVASTYGGGTYGGDTQTYGREATDPLSNVESTLAPADGDWPNEVGWVYRVGEQGARFQAVVLTLDGPLDLSVFASAALIIERATPGERVIIARPLTIGADDVLEYEWAEGDITDRGAYRVIVQLVADSGRPMSVSASDNATLIVRSG